MLPIAILAGGLATRLGSLTEKIPKSMIPIAGKPFVVHQLELLRKNGIERVILCVGHYGEMIEPAVGDGRQWGMNIEYSYDGEVLLGTAGAIRTALPKLRPNFFVMYGDSYLTCDFAGVEREFLRSGKKGLMTVFRNEGQWDTSNVECEDGRILAYSKKERTPRMCFIDYGLGVFRAEALASTRATDLADVYAELLQSGELDAMEVHERFYEIGSVAGLLETTKLLSEKENRLGEVPE